MRRDSRRRERDAPRKHRSCYPECHPKKSLITQARDAFFQSPSRNVAGASSPIRSGVQAGWGWKPQPRRVRSSRYKRPTTQSKSACTDCWRGWLSYPGWRDSPKCGIVAHHSESPPRGTGPMRVRHGHFSPLFAYQLKREWESCRNQARSSTKSASHPSHDGFDSIFQIFGLPHREFVAAGYRLSFISS